MPAATRVGDADLTHCSGMTRAVGSQNVFVNGMPWSRAGDINTEHELVAYPYCIPHEAPITVGSLTVFVNNLGAGRVGDILTACTMVAAGSPNVFAG